MQSSQWPSVDEVISKVNIPIGPTPLSRRTKSKEQLQSLYDDQDASENSLSPVQSPSPCGDSPCNSPVNDYLLEEPGDEWFMRWANQFSNSDGEYIAVPADPVELKLYNTLRPVNTCSLSRS